MGSIKSKPVPCIHQVSLSQFQSLSVIGKGSFGKVRIVHHIERKDERYAMKCISKSHCIQMNAVRNILRERAILEQLDHPLVCNMRFAFQDADTLYMVMDLMLGGDMRFHMSRHTLSENVIRCWMAELICSVKYLHSQGFVHRDIKPDNLLLDQEGHVHLSDFNIACSMPRCGLLSSRSGTAVYFAPEIFRGCGYNESVDWWSVGITFYECIYGKRPWKGSEKNKDLANTVLRGSISYPTHNGKHQVSSNCISVLQGLLAYDPNHRLGYGQEGWHALVHHPFFHSIDWQAINSRKATPLFRPSSQVNYDLIHDIEDNFNGLLSNHKPYYYPMGWLFGSKSTEQDEYHMHQMKDMEINFKPFDYTIYDNYEGFLDPHLRTVGPPPPWVKPAFASITENKSSLPLAHDSAQGGDDRTHILSPLSAPSCQANSNGMESSHTTQQTKNEELFKRNSRADSACTFASSMEELKNKRRSSAQSFKERRERDRRRSTGKIRQESNGTLIAMIH
ncbi:kinase-like domain-containing protein [Spinellus fusiger]|nr:kinase-like domain-containing protein [Spinellus fusiger]